MKQDVVPERSRPVEILPVSRWLRVANRLMVPIMYLAQGNVRESPQETHFWNNRTLTFAERLSIKEDPSVNVFGDATASRRWFGKLPLFHIPILGGWKNYVVLSLDMDDVEYFVGWIAPDTVGVSLLPLYGPVRLLRGPLTTRFFAVNRQGQQLALKNRGYGKIGTAPPAHARLPLR